MNNSGYTGMIICKSKHKKSIQICHIIYSEMYLGGNAPGEIPRDSDIVWLMPGILLGLTDHTDDSSRGLIDHVANSNESVLMQYFVI